MGGGKEGGGRWGGREVCWAGLAVANARGYMRHKRKDMQTDRNEKNRA